MKWIEAHAKNGTCVLLAVDAEGVFWEERDGVQRQLGPISGFVASLTADRRYVEIGHPSLGAVRSNELRVLEAWFSHVDLFKEPGKKPRSPETVVWGFMGSMLVAVILTFWLVIPWLAGIVAGHVPKSWERQLAAGTLEQLASEGFKLSTVDAATQAKYRALIAKLTKGLDPDVSYQLEFRDWTDPNAFAAPGGLIVITDPMLKLISSDEEFLSVMAHEIGHVEMRHGLRTALQQGSSWLVISMLWGDASALGTLTIALPSILIQSAYSRGFEREADQYAFKRLKELGISPRAFASLMAKLAKESGRSSGDFQYFSSHPATEERVAAAERAAAD